MAKPATQELTEEKISQLLAQGILLTMEEDLRRLQAQQSKELRFQRQREAAKIMPVSGARPLAKPVPQEAPPSKAGFLGKLASRVVGLLKKEKPRVVEKPPFVSTVPQVPSRPAPQPAAETALPTKPAVPLIPVRPLPPLTRPIPEIPIQPLQPIPPVSVIKEEEKEKKAVSPPTAEAKSKQLLITKEEALEVIAKREELEKERQLLDRQLKGFIPEKKPQEAKIAALEKERQAMKAALSPILKRESELEAERSVTEQKESQAKSIEEKHTLESQRWSIERQRRKIEQEKWVQQEKIEAKSAEIAEIGKKLKAILDKEKQLEVRKREIATKLEQAELFEKVALFDRSKQALDEQLSFICEKEKETEQKAGELEEKEKQAKTTQESRALEKQRWELEEQRRRIEQKRWQIEKKKQDLQEEVKGIILPEKTLEKPAVAPVEVALPEKPSVLTPPALLEARPLTGAAKGETAPPVPAQDIVQPRRPSREWQPVKHVVTPGYVEPAKPAKEEKLIRPEVSSSELSEEELVAQIRQKAKQEDNRRKIQAIQRKAEEQRGTYVPKSRGPISKAKILQKLSTISPEEQKARESFLAKVAGKPQAVDIKTKAEGGEVVFRPVVKRSSIIQKIAARLMFLVLVLGCLVAIALLLHIYVFSRKPSPPPGVSPAVEQPVVPVVPSEVPPEVPPEAPPEIPPEQPPVEPTSTPPEIPQPPEVPMIPLPPAVQLPEALITVSTTTLLTFSPLMSVSELLGNVLENPSREQGFVQLVFQDEMTKELLAFDEFLKAVDIKTPAGLSETLEAPATLFVYYSSEKNRLGFVAPVKEPTTLISALRSWEATMESDTADFFLLAGKTGPAVSKKFLTAKYGNEGFRYQTFTKSDLGICYAVTKSNYFIFTTSYDVMKLTLDNLANKQ